MMRRVIVELTNGRQVAGELLEECPGRSQQIIDGDNIEIVFTSPGIILNRGFANPVYYEKSEIARIYEVSFKSQLN